MNDQMIKELLFLRSEKGLEELDKAYGKLCRRIAVNLLGDRQDAEECVNDAYLAVWNRIPPVDPESLPAYLCQIVRNICLKRLRSDSAKKRASSHTVAMEELSSDIPAFSGVEEEVLQKELAQEINAFIRSVSSEDRYLFMQRYWYGEPIRTIAKNTGRTGHYVSVRLSRLRQKLKEYLKTQGVCI